MTGSGATIGQLAGSRLHLIGMAGRGMAPLAIASRHLGAEVSGCDVAGFQVQRDALADSGIDLLAGHDPAHLDRVSAVIAASIATGREVDEARDRGVLFHRTDLLAQVMLERPGAGITGSHGKGTVTALASAAAAAAGLDPLAIIGASVPALGGVARVGHGPVIAEVDDSDLTLVRVLPRIAVVTNLDDDHPHLPYSLAESEAAVARYVDNATASVILGRGARLAAMGHRAPGNRWVLGRDFQVRLVSTTPERQRLSLHGPGGERVAADIRLLGAAVADNVALAFAVALAMGAEPEAAADGLSQVDRIDRRLEPVGERNGVVVIDDFGGKHPVNVREGLRAIRKRYTGARITAVFEPYAPYLSRWAYRYARALGLADRVILAPPVTLAHYAPGSAARAEWWRACPVPVQIVASQEEAVAAALDQCRPGDVVVFFAQVNASRRMALSAVGAGPAPSRLGADRRATV